MESDDAEDLVRAHLFDQPEISTTMRCNDTTVTRLTMVH